MRNSFQQQNIARVKALDPKVFGGSRKKKSPIKHLESSEYPILQMFVRRYEHGPWSRYEDVLADGSLHNITLDIIKYGGLEAELLRDDFEVELIKKVLLTTSFYSGGITARLPTDRILIGRSEKEEQEENEEEDGDGDGDGTTVEVDSPIIGTGYTEAARTLLTKVKKLLPAFRKIHSKEIQFGYRIFSEGEAIFPINLFEADTSNVFKRNSMTQGGSQVEEPTRDVVRLDLYNLIKEHRNVMPLQTITKTERLKSFTSWSHVLESRLHQYCSDVLRDIIENQNLCVDSGSRINGNPIFTSDIYEDDNDDLSKSDDSEEWLEEDESLGLALEMHVCSDGSAFLDRRLPVGAQCIQASGGMMMGTFLSGCRVDGGDNTYAVDNSDLEASMSNVGFHVHSLCLQVNHVEGAVESPFDSELSAAVMSISMVRLMVDELLTIMTQHYNEYYLKKFKIVLLTDSKTLARALRNGCVGDFADRSSPSRLAAWNLALDHIDYLIDMGFDVHIQWVPGHPERRHKSHADWTLSDMSIYTADKVAAPMMEITDPHVRSLLSLDDQTSHRAPVSYQEILEYTLTKLHIPDYSE